MGSIQYELNFNFVPKTITDLLNNLKKISDDSEKSSKLNEYLKNLEDEMRKIDAFKRELPLCMLLLKDVILYLKNELMQCNSANVEPVLEEFIPLIKGDCNEDHNNEVDHKKEDCKDKKNWMCSVQLWNSNEPRIETEKVEEEVNHFAVEHPLKSCKVMEESKRSVPFKGYPNLFSRVMLRTEDKKVSSLPGFALLASGIKNYKEDLGSSQLKPSVRKVSSSPNVLSNLRTGPQQSPQQTSRKQRRCWSQELHRRFVKALHDLGGSQVATPKQIRDLMQVDGLTNDEVKSHLQKYRLHLRRNPQDQYNESSKKSNSQSGSPQGPFQLNGNNNGGDCSMDDDDNNDKDEKSESYDWRNHIHTPVKNDV